MMRVARETSTLPPRVDDSAVDRVKTRPGPLFRVYNERYVCFFSFKFSLSCMSHLYNVVST